MKRRLFFVLAALAATVGVAASAGGALDRASLEDPIALAHASPPIDDTSADHLASTGAERGPFVHVVPVGRDLDAPPHLGVLLGDGPLSELVATHLQLPAGQGLAVDNVVVGSPADAAGLERHDIIVEVDGEPVTDTAAFVEHIRAMQVGQQVELEIVHAGARRSLSVTLGARPDDDREVAWKFPQRERRGATMLAPGMGRQLPPELLEQLGQLDLPDGFGRQLGDLDAFFDLPMQAMPGAADARIYRESHTRLDAQGRTETVTIQIDGPPDAPDTALAVVIDGDHRSDEYRATVADLDTLPDDVRELVDRALDNAARNRLRGLSHPLFGNDAVDDAFEQRLDHMRRQLQRDGQPS